MLPMRLPLHLVCNSCESKFVIFPVGLTCFIFQGNVALDDACILLQPTKEMAMTDMASHALNALEESSIRWLLQLLLNPLQVNMNCTLFSSTNLIVFQNQKKKKRRPFFWCALREDSPKRFQWVLENLKILTVGNIFWIASFHNSYICQL
ncbi:uncharacterized protein LOC123200713 [Mangifera indica]|uniref:uncharacterized protein LOC123200713 n=1 Tax=Mangifera indica TaxID=29780 RepID=UPI001CFB7D27|nr:uncharacterized protein LOC123200713 [Mangifera indica]